MNELTPDEHNIIVDAIHDSAIVIHKGQRMNERIKQLAEQATKHYPATETSGEFSIFDKAKFAELIVRECIECADMVGKNNLASGYPNSTAHHVKQKIKEHFGVEE